MSTPFQELDVLKTRAPIAFLFFNGDLFVVSAIVFMHLQYYRLSPDNVPVQDVIDILSPIRLILFLGNGVLLLSD